MKNLEKGKFFGNSRKEFHINGLTIVDSEFYHYKNCPWHYHQNAHFAFTTKGNLTETHKKRKSSYLPVAYYIITARNLIVIPGIQKMYLHCMLI